MPTQNHDKIATRLTWIIQGFNDGRRFSAQELAEEFNVSLRTIQRDLHERLGFLPIVKEDGIYRLEPYALGKLTSQDIRNFAILSGIGALYPSLDISFVSDLLNERVNTIFGIKGWDHERWSPHQTKDFEAAGAAILHHRQVTFTYHDKPRTANPYKLINKNGIWYLLADESGILKHFAFSKIQRFKVLDETFTPDPAKRQRADESGSGWVSDDPFTGEVAVDRKVQEYFLRRDLLPDQQIVRQTDTALILSTRVAYDEEILGIARYWLPHIRILSPASLQTQLEERLRGYLEA
jgi:predicted DNA-binding transcriptional regulator YafY